MVPLTYFNHNYDKWRYILDEHKNDFIQDIYFPFLYNNSDIPEYNPKCTYIFNYLDKPILLGKILSNIANLNILPRYWGTKEDKND